MRGALRAALAARGQTTTSHMAAPDSATDWQSAVTNYAQVRLHAGTKRGNGPRLPLALKSV
jgi:hypothetical protein